MKSFPKILAGGEREAGSGGMRSRLRRETEPTEKGKWLGADGWTARGVYSDGPRRLTGRPGPSEVEIFYLGIYVDIISN